MLWRSGVRRSAKAWLVWRSALSDFVSRYSAIIRSSSLGSLGSAIFLSSEAVELIGEESQVWVMAG